MESLVQDSRHALRMFRENPAFTAVAVLVLAVGIGVNTAVFSILNRVLLAPIQVPEPDRLVFIMNKGNDGTPIVLMHSTDLQVLTNLAPVAKSLMERAGFKVDMQSMDWQSVVARRAKKDPPQAGGWHAFLTSWVSADVLNPVMTAFLNSSCDKALFGWPCDAEMEKLRDQYARETDPGKQKAIAEAVQLRWAQNPGHIPLGQWYQPAAMRWRGQIRARHR